MYVFDNICQFPFGKSDIPLEECDRDTYYVIQKKN